METPKNPNTEKRTLQLGTRPGDIDRRPSTKNPADIDHDAAQDAATKKGE